MQTEIRNKEASTKEQLLKITVDLINEGDIEGITVRKIAQIANANIGAVNYHFGTKERLLDEAIRVIFAPIRDIFYILEDETLEPRAKLKKFLTAIAVQITLTPTPLKYYIATKKFIADEQNVILKFLREAIMGKLVETLALMTGEKDIEKLTVLAFQIDSAIILPNLLISKNSPFGMELPNAETQVEILLEHIK